MPVLTKSLAAALLLLLLAPVARAEGKAVLRTWVDADGVTHIRSELGPSKAAREKAVRVDVVPRSGAKRQKVHETSAWDAHIEEAARKYDIPHALVRAIIVAESNFDPMAVSRVGARGLMQLMPATAREVYVDDVHDPAQNIDGGTRYLRVLANMFDGDIVRTVAAYNAGPQAVRRAKGIPPYRETQDYVRKVVRLYRIYKGVD